MLRSFFIALGFLTIIPSPKIEDWQADDFAKSTRAYPLVALLLGAILFAIALALGKTDAFLRAAILLSSWYLLTGGLHFDGLCDTADAVFASKSPAERQIIAKDPRIGSFALLTALLVMLLKLAAVFAIADYQILLFAPIISRSIILPAMAYFPVQSSSQIGKMANISLASASFIFLFAVLMTLVISLFIGKTYLLMLALGLTTVFVTGLSFWLNQQMQGLNGDNYGTIIELSELCLLLVFALFN